MGSLLRDNRATIIAGVIIAGILAALLVWQRSSTQAQGRMVALVHDADGKVYELPLDKDATLEVSTSLGTNTVAVEAGSVRMVPTGTVCSSMRLPPPEGRSSASPISCG